MELVPRDKVTCYGVLFLVLCAKELYCDLKKVHLGNPLRPVSHVLIAFLEILRYWTWCFFNPL